MEHIAAIMVLIGCGHGDVDCKEVSAPTVGYETVQVCESEMENVLRTASDRFPVIYGKCATVDPAAFEQDMILAWDFADNGDLMIDMIASDTLYASTAE